MEVGPDRTEPLLSVADLQQVIVTADVLERDTAGLKVGQTARVTDVALGGESVEGTVEYIAQLVDPARRTPPRSGWWCRPRPSSPTTRSRWCS